MPSKKETLTVLVIMALFLLLTTVFIGLRSEHLLIAGDNFPGLFIKQGEEAGHLQQTFRRKQADEQFVLSTDSQFTPGD